MVAAGWYELAPSAHPKVDAASDEAFAAPPVLPAMPLPAQEPAPAPTAATLAADTTLEAGSAPPNSAAAGPPSAAADEAAVMAMYQNMADAVDAYGPDACAALGQAFGVFVADGSPSTSRLVRSAKAKGEDFTAWLEANHGPQLDRVKEKLRQAISRCGTDPGLRKALTDLAQLT